MASNKAFVRYGTLWAWFSDYSQQLLLKTYFTQGPQTAVVFMTEINKIEQGAYLLTSQSLRFASK